MSRARDLHDGPSGIVDVLPNVVWTTSQGGEFDFVNRRWCEFTGLAFGDSTGSGWRAAVHPEDVAELLATWRAGPEPDRSHEKLVRFRHRDGSYRWFMFRSAALRDSSGSFLKWCGTGTDVDALAASERNLTKILKTLPTSYWTTEPDGFCDFVSDRWLDYAGITAEQARGWGWASAIHPEDLQGLSDIWAGALASGLPTSAEARILGRDSKYRWFFFRANPLRDESGAIIKWYGTNVDIDDRKRSDEALKAKERALNQIINTLPVTAWSTEPDGYCDFLNHRWLDYAGFTFEEAVGWGWAAVIHPDDVPGLTEYWKGCLESGTPVDTEARMRGRDGTYRWFLFRANPLRDASGAIIKWYGTNIDIDDRKRADDDLKLSRELLEKGQRLSSTGSFVWRVDSERVDFSNELRRIFEIDPEVPVTLELAAERVHPEDVPLLAEKIEHARQGYDDLDYEIRLLARDGTTKHLHTNAYGTRDPNGAIEIIGATQDITERRLTENALAEARAELERVARITTLGELTASIAHEVSQPLSGIITNSGTCLRFLSADPPNLNGAAEAAQRIASDGKRASEVISRIRSLFTRKIGVIELLDLNATAREVVTLSLNALQRNRITVREELADDIPHVAGDRVQLQQVLMNLFLNAADAMREVKDRPRVIVLRTQNDEDGYVRLSVQDAGVGIDPESERKVFEPFYTTKEGGMGIGLSISRSIVERHGGRLWATPNEVAGTTFSFTIPTGLSSG